MKKKELKRQLEVTQEENLKLELEIFILKAESNELHIDLTSDRVELERPIYTEDLKSKVLTWAAERDILHKENHTKQFIKLTEEVGELGSALLKQDRLKIIDAIGDIRVVITILAKQLELDDDECLEMAYNEIKNRTGKTINGTFIKDGN
jgi:NTP pyrophosphatase (non-canonical NTP hydrolase)